MVAGGRPRSFDIDKALGRALTLFWAQGYECTSIADLTDAMGIKPSSLYAAFGSKAALFTRVLDRYIAAQQQYVTDALAQPTAVDVVASMLHGVVDAVTIDGRPHGCLTVQAALAPSAAPEVRERLADCRERGIVELATRFAQAQGQGDLPPHACPANLARIVTTLVHGVSVQAVSGASAQELHLMADTIACSWPSLVDSSRSAAHSPSRT